MPSWLLALQLAVQLEPTLAAGIQQLVVAGQAGATLSTAQMAQFQQAMNAAIAQMDSDIAAKFPAPPTMAH